MAGESGLAVGWCVKSRARLAGSIRSNTGWWSILIHGHIHHGIAMAAAI
jgi:hypothetical protein